MGRGASSSADEVEFQTITSEILGIYDVDVGATTRKEEEEWEVMRCLSVSLRVSVWV